MQICETWEAWRRSDRACRSGAKPERPGGVVTENADLRNLGGLGSVVTGNPDLEPKLGGFGSVVTENPDLEPKLGGLGSVVTENPDLKRKLW